MQGGETPLHDAAINEHLPIAKLLIKYGADINQVLWINLAPNISRRLLITNIIEVHGCPNTDILHYRPTAEE